MTTPSSISETSSSITIGKSSGGGGGVYTAGANISIVDNVISLNISENVPFHTFGAELIDFVSMDLITITDDLDNNNKPGLKISGRLTDTSVSVFVPSYRADGTPAEDGDSYIYNQGLIQAASPSSFIANLPVFTGDAGTGGQKGLVPAPAAGDFNAGKFLSAGGSWSAVGADKLTGSTLASAVTSSSLTSLGTLASLSVSGISGLGSGSLKVNIGSNSNTFTGLFDNIVSGTGASFLFGVNCSLNTVGRPIVQANDAEVNGCAIVLGGYNATYGTNSIAFYTQQPGVSVPGNEIPVSMVLNSNGWLGIGGPSPLTRLDVGGAIHLNADPQDSNFVKVAMHPTNVNVNNQYYTGLSYLNDSGVLSSYSLSFNMNLLQNGNLTINSRVWNEVSSSYDSFSVFEFIALTGNINLNRPGARLSIDGTGTSRGVGTVTLVAGSAVVSNTSITSQSVILLTTQGGDLGHVGSVYISSKTNGTGFTISSTNNQDASTVGYFIFNITGL